MSEERRKFEGELRDAFAAMYPLAPKHSLPWAPGHIAEFLRKRIKTEIECGTQHWTSDIVRVLCEVSHPKTHAVDMARIVVEKAKRYEALRVAMQQVVLDHPPASLGGPQMVSVPEEMLEQIKYLLAVYPEPNEA